VRFLRRICPAALALLLLFSGCANTPTESADDKPAVTDPYGITLEGGITDGGLAEQKTNFPLYAALPGDDFYLYGINPHGMVLYHKNNGCYFDWPGLTPRGILPKMSYFDCDGDGKKELAVTLYWASGTELSLMDLHILKIEEHKDSWPPVEYRDYAILSQDGSSQFGDGSPSEIDKLLNENFPFILADGGKTVSFIMDGKEYSANNDFDEDANFFEGIVYGNIVHFDIQDDHSITAEIAIGFKYENFAFPQYFADVIADVSFDGKQFKFSNKRINFHTQGEESAP